MKGYLHVLVFQVPFYEMFILRLELFVHLFLHFFFFAFTAISPTFLELLAPRSPDKQKTCVQPLWGIFCLLDTALCSYHQWSFCRIQIFLCTCSAELDTWVSAWHPWLSHHLGFSVILFCSVLEKLRLASSIIIPLPTFMLEAWVVRKMFVWDRILGIGRHGHDKFRDKK